jgi:hypothetical protein
MEPTSVACGIIHDAAELTGGQFHIRPLSKKWDSAPPQLQADLDTYMDFNNRERSHQGYRTRGRTPYQGYLDGIEALKQKTVDQ